MQGRLTIDVYLAFKLEAAFLIRARCCDGNRSQSASINKHPPTRIGPIVDKNHHNTIKINKTRNNKYDKECKQIYRLLNNISLRMNQKS